MKKILLTLTAALSLTACEVLNTSTETAANIILASDKIDSMQTKLGEYSSNQVALVELDILQADIKNTMTTGDDALKIIEYQARGLTIYSTLKLEVTERWDELDVEQQDSLIALDNELIAINATLNSLQEYSLFDSVTGASTDAIELLYRATVLMTYYKGVF